MIDWQTHLPTLQALKEEGKIGMVGVSAMVREAYPTIMDLMRQGRVDAVQIPYNVMNRGVDEELLPLAEELGTGVLVMEPPAKGPLRYRAQAAARPHSAAQLRHQHLGPVPAGVGCIRLKGQLGHTHNLPARANQRKCPGRFLRNSAPSSSRLHSLRGGTVPVAMNASGLWRSSGPRG